MPIAYLTLHLECTTSYLCWWLLNIHKRSVKLGTVGVADSVAWRRIPENICHSSGNCVPYPSSIKDSRLTITFNALEALFVIWVLQVAITLTTPWATWNITNFTKKRYRFGKTANAIRWEAAVVCQIGHWTLKLYQSVLNVYGNWLFERREFTQAALGRYTTSRICETRSLQTC